MRILFVADTCLENPASGSEKVLYHQASNLAKKSIDVFAITRGHAGVSDKERNIDGIHEISYCAPPDRMLPFAMSLFQKPVKIFNRLVAEGTFQAAVCHHPFTNFMLLFRGKLKNLPIVHVFHSPTHEEYALIHEQRSRIRNFFPIRMRRMVEKHCHQRASRIMVLSEYMRRKVESLYSIPADKIIVNPGGVDLHRFLPPKNRKSLKKDLCFPEGKIHLLTVRNLEKRMGLDNLLRCMHFLMRKMIPVHLTIGGEGEERGVLEQLIRKYRLSDMVNLAGFIPEEKLSQYYGAADFFVLPTRRLEGFGLVTPESMACGTPVLGTPIGGTVEILSGFEPSLLFRGTSPEAMEEGILWGVENYFRNEKKYSQLRSRSRKYIEERYSWDRHVNYLYSLIQQLVRTDKGIQPHSWDRD